MAEYIVDQTTFEIYTTSSGSGSGTLFTTASNEFAILNVDGVVSIGGTSTGITPTHEVYIGPSVTVSAGSSVNYHAVIFRNV